MFIVLNFHDRRLILLYFSLDFTTLGNELDVLDTAISIAVCLYQDIEDPILIKHYLKFV